MKKLITICAVVGMLLTASANVKGGVIADPCLWLQFEGTDGQTTTVDSSVQLHPISLLSGAQLDTAYQAVGVSSLLLDGSNDYGSSPDSPDWDICGNITDSWTIDFYVRHGDHAGTEYYLRQRVPSSGAPSTYWRITHAHGSGLSFVLESSGGGGAEITLPAAGEITDSEWHWIVLAKVGAEYAMYKDGTQVNYISDTSTGTIAGPLEIGDHGPSGSALYGNMDELRIFHDNVFGARPQSDFSDTITNIPEPATMALLGLGTLSLIRRKRKI